MANRLDKQQQMELEPNRIKYAINKLRELGIEPGWCDNTHLVFIHKGHYVKFYPYSGWHTGKTIKDGRGINNLLKQLTIK